eukprot:gene17981-23613_t
MLNSYSPLLPGRLPAILPPPLRSNIPGTWAYDTMSYRISNDIFPRLIKDNEDELTRPTSSLRSECLLQLNDLKSNLDSGKYGYLLGINDSGPDIDYWSQTLNSIPDNERNWLDAPWIITEFYFYRRINEIFKYFETGYDMFIPQKFSGLVSAMTSINDICNRLPSLLDTANQNEILTIGIQTSLWGNKIDLSLWPANKASDTSNESSDNAAGKISYGNLLDSSKKYILDDHTNEIVDYLLNQSKTYNEIGIVVDNAGYELFSDLLLGYILIQLKIADKVTYHTKGHPTFVSDATNQDLIETINFLIDEGDENTKTFANELKSYVDSKQFIISDDLFWCQPTPFWDMPENIQRKISKSCLVFVKGDANYRRLLGERDWLLETPAKDILSYWPVPVFSTICFNI